MASPVQSFSSSTPLRAGTGRRTPGLALLCALLALVAGCRERRGTPLQRFEAVANVGSASAANTAPGASARPTTPANLLVPSTLERVSAELRRRVGDTASALMLEVTPDHATIQVEAPTRPGSVVQYEWADGTLRGPIPVELRGPGTLEHNLFPLSSVDVAELPALVKTAIERIDKENGQLERIVVRRNLPVEETVGIRVYVKSPIRSSHVDADARGRIVETSRIP